MNVPQLWPIAATQLDGTMYRSSCGSTGNALVTATSRMNPKKTEATTDMYMPTAAQRDASWVSSATCAEASKPVIVYWAMRRPGQEHVAEDECPRSCRRPSLSRSPYP